MIWRTFSFSFIGTLLIDEPEDASTSHQNSGLSTSSRGPVSRATTRVSVLAASSRALHYAADSSLSLELAHSDRSLTRLLHRTRLRGTGARATGSSFESGAASGSTDDTKMDVDDEGFRVPACPPVEEPAFDPSLQKSVLSWNNTVRLVQRFSIMGNHMLLLFHPSTLFICIPQIFVYSYSIYHKSSKTYMYCGICWRTLTIARVIESLQLATWRSTRPFTCSSNCSSICLVKNAKIAQPLQLDPVNFILVLYYSYKF